MRSIRRTLLLFLFLGLSLGIALVAALLYEQARHAANQIFDYQMQQMAASLPSQSFSPVPPGRYEEPGTEKDIVIQIWDETGVRIYRSHEQPSLPQRAELGFSNVATRSGVWRVYSAQQGDTIVQVAQPESVRRQVAADTALKTVAPLLLLFPFLGALIWLTVSRGLAPIKRVAADVQSRDAGALAPIVERGLPQEIRPLTRALNDLLARLDRSIDVQRAFIADAAHELRTPLTALKLQIQLAQRADSEEERKAAFAEVEQGFERATHMVQQLLTLARQEPGAVQHSQQDVDLAVLAQEVLADQALAAEEKQINLGLDVQAINGAAIVHGDPEGLRILLNNLVDNAIRYTPGHGNVDVMVKATPSTLALTVNDSGPGIPQQEHLRVFDRFYRVAGTDTQGSGLGLAIVKQIAEAHHAQVSLLNTGHGLSVNVVFPNQKKYQSV
jgi:two-component system OmpR family sensor kinase